jgi:hypothetical protein
LYLVPGCFLVAVGLLGYAVAMPGFRLGTITFDAHTLLVSSLLIVLGYQSVIFGVLAKTFAVSEGLMPMTPRLEKFYATIDLERGLLIGATLCVAGAVPIGIAAGEWIGAGFGDLSYRRTMRLVVPGVTALAVGTLTLLASFFASVLGLKRR